MAIITALEKAKTYLSFPDSSGALGRLIGAEAAARSQFEQDYPLSYKIQLAGESFNSVSVTKIDEEHVKVEVEKSVAKRLYNFASLQVASGNYKDKYVIENLDKTANTFIIEAEYFDEVITFENLEWQIYENALGWLVCYMARFSLQEIIENNIMITSSQLGEGNINSFSVNSIKNFQNQLMANFHKTLGSRSFPTGC